VVPATAESPATFSRFVEFSPLAQRRNRHRRWVDDTRLRPHVLDLAAGPYQRNPDTGSRAAGRQLASRPQRDLGARNHCDLPAGRRLGHQTTDDFAQRFVQLREASGMAGLNCAALALGLDDDPVGVGGNVAQPRLWMDQDLTPITILGPHRAILIFVHATLPGYRAALNVREPGNVREEN